MWRLDCNTRREKDHNKYQRCLCISRLFLLSEQVSTRIHYKLGATIKITFRSGLPLSFYDIESCVILCRCCEYSTIQRVLVNPSVLIGIATISLVSGTQASWSTTESHLASGGSRFNVNVFWIEFQTSKSLNNVWNLSKDMRATRNFSEVSWNQGTLINTSLKKTWKNDIIGKILGVFSLRCS